MSKAAFDTKQWDTFWKVWNRRLETLPGAKKAALFQAGQAVDALLERQISTRVNDPRGRVKRWQELRLGSGGGYAAISPADDNVRVSRSTSNKYTAKDITRYLERGHKIRPPSGRWRRYRSRVQERADANGKHSLVGIVPGRMFYSWTKMEATAVAVRAAREEILEWIEGFAEGDE